MASWELVHSAELRSCLRLAGSGSDFNRSSGDLHIHCNVRNLALEYVFHLSVGMSMQG